MQEVDHDDRLISKRAGDVAINLYIRRIYEVKN
jgi:hypothetical protein